MRSAAWQHLNIRWILSFNTLPQSQDQGLFAEPGHAMNGCLDADLSCCKVNVAHFQTASTRPKYRVFPAFGLQGLHMSHAARCCMQHHKRHPLGFLFQPRPLDLTTPPNTSSSEALMRPNWGVVSQFHALFANASRESLNLQTPGSQPTALLLTSNSHPPEQTRASDPLSFSYSNILWPGP